MNVKDPAKMEDALARLKKLAQPVSPSLLTGRGGGGLDLSVNASENGVITIEPTLPGLQHRVESAVSRSIEVIRRRIDPEGTTEATIQAEGQDRLLIQVPGLAPSEVKARIGTTAKLTFQIVDTSDNPGRSRRPTVCRQTISCCRTRSILGSNILVRREVLVSGDDIVNARRWVRQPQWRGWRPRGRFRAQHQGRRGIRARYTG